MSQVVSVLLKNNILQEKSGRTHSLFKKLNINPLATLDRKKMNEWIEKKRKETMKLMCALGEGNLSDSEATDDDDDADSEHSDSD